MAKSGKPIAIVVLLGAVAAAVYLLVPLRSDPIAEGPMLQQVTESSAILIWYGGEAAALTVTVDGADYARELTVTPRNGRYQVHLEQLRAATDYRYAIRHETSQLFEATFRTAGDVTMPLRILVFGDSGTGTRAQYRLGEEMARQDAQVVLHTGDVIYEHGERDHYPQRFFQPYAELLSRVAVWPVLGNHDMHKPAQGQPFLDVFTLPQNGPQELVAESNYWFALGSVRIAAIDTTGDRAAKLDALVPWLGAVFTDSPEQWKIVLSHYCPYSVIRERPALQDMLAPALEELAVDLVLCGHDHFYMRSHPMQDGRPVPGDRGVSYLISGAAADLTDASPEQRNMPFVAVLDSTMPSYTLIDVSLARLKLRQIGLDGSLLDEFVLDRQDY